MHEWSIALELVKLAEKEAKARGADSVAEVQVSLGRLNHIVAEQLRDAFEVAKAGTMLSSCELKIEVVKARGKCVSCDKEFDIEPPFILCPVCGNIDVVVLCGDEMFFKRAVLEVKDV